MTGPVPTIEVGRYEDITTKAELVRYVRDKLLQQGQTSMQASRPGEYPGNVCQYRTGNLRCAIGWLIPDDEYDKRLEGYCIESILREVDPFFLERILPPKLPITESLVTVLAWMQHIHDQCDVDEWPDHFDRLIKEVSRER